MIFWYFVEVIYENHESTFFAVPLPLNMKAIVLRNARKGISSNEVLILSGIRFDSQIWEFSHITTYSDNFSMVVGGVKLLSAEQLNSDNKGVSLFLCFSKPLYIFFTQNQKKLRDVKYVGVVTSLCYYIH